MPVSAPVAKSGDCLEQTGWQPGKTGPIRPWAVSEVVRVAVLYGLPPRHEAEPD